MAIRRNSEKNEIVNQISDAPGIPKATEVTAISNNIQLTKINKLKAGLPPTELLEVGGITEWVQLRTEQLLELSDENKTHTGISQILGLSVSVAGFVLTGGALAPIAGIAAGLGLIGYGLGVADTAARLNKILPIPFSSFTLQKLATSTSADARVEVGFDDDNPMKTDKLAFLPNVIAKELEMITDYQLLVIDLLNSIPEGKRFNVYQSLKQIMLDVGFDGNEEKIAKTINKIKDVAKIDSTLDKDKMEHFKLMIDGTETNQPESIENKTIESSDRLTYTLPMDKVRKEQLLEDSNHKPDELISGVVENLGNTVICSPGGGGKGIVVSNALREVKRRYPDVHIFYIDPKGSDKETGYFDNCTDTLLRYKSLGKSTNKCVEAYEKMWGEFYKLVEQGKRILLVIDEATTLGNNYGLAGKADLLKKRISELPSLGGDSGLKTWIICQNPHVKDLGINTGVLNQFAKLAILTTKDGTAPGMFNTLVNTTKFIPNKKYVWDDIKVLCDESKVDRAFYYSKFDEWLPMPELKNYSGYDRDTNTFTNNQKTVIQSEQPTVIQDEKQTIETLIGELIKNDSSDLAEAIKTIEPNLSSDEIDMIKAKVINFTVMTMNSKFLNKFGIISK